MPRDEQNAEVKLHSSSAREIGLTGEKQDLQIAALLHRFHLTRFHCVKNVAIMVAMIFNGCGKILS